MQPLFWSFGTVRVRFHAYGEEGNGSQMQPLFWSFGTVCVRSHAHALSNARLGIEGNFTLTEHTVDSFDYLNNDSEFPDGHCALIPEGRTVGHFMEYGSHEWLADRAETPLGTLLSKALQVM
eukprot:9485954-Pyramimonas_sp.AAC.1